MNDINHRFNLFFKLLFALAVSAILVYFTPPVINRSVFLLLLIMVWKTKNDFFWFAYLMIIMDIPGGLFSGGSADELYRLPIYSVAPGISLTIQELYMILIFIKALVNGRNRAAFRRFPYDNQLRNVLVLFVILIVLTFLLGASFYSVRAIYKTLIILSVFYSQKYIFRKHEDIVGFFKALFPFTFVAVVLQLYSIVYGHQLIAAFRPGVILTQGVLTGDLLRPIEMSVILLACSFGSFLFLGGRHGPFSVRYLLILNVVAFLGIIMTATRSWFLGFSCMYIFFIALNYNRMGSVIFKYFIGLLFFGLVLSFIPLIGGQVSSAFTRLNTITYIATGDYTAGGTLGRITERAPLVMQGFWNSTIIFGAGYSQIYLQHADGHVGFHNILLNSGIVGFAIFMILANALFFKPIRLARISKGNLYRDALRNLPILVPAVLIITSSTQFWGFGIDSGRAMFLAAYISISGFYVMEVRSSLLMKGRMEAPDKSDAEVGLTGILNN